MITFLLVIIAALLSVPRAERYKFLLIAAAALFVIYYANTLLGLGVLAGHYLGITIGFFGTVLFMLMIISVPFTVAFCLVISNHLGFLVEREGFESA